MDTIKENRIRQMLEGFEKAPPGASLKLLLEEAYEAGYDQGAEDMEDQARIEGYEEGQRDLRDSIIDFLK